MKLELEGICGDKKETLDLGEPEFRKVRKELDCVYGTECKAMEVIKGLCLKYDGDGERFKGIQRCLASGINAWFEIGDLVRIGIDWDDWNLVSYIPLRPYKIRT